MHIANSDKPVRFYSLDVIISVGYRVKSQRGVQFRQWATKTPYFSENSKYGVCFLRA
ncbi:MAG: RhuM family protein [Vibrio sp.]